MELKGTNSGEAYFLLFYNDSNLGDDLFLEMLVRRYPKTNFFIYVGDGKPPLNKTFRQYRNLHFADTSLSNKTINSEMSKYSGLILIGGSVFQDLNYSLYRTNLGRYLIFRKLIKSGKKVFVLGSNLGPFNTLFGKLIVRLTLRQITHICVRESHSFELLEKWGISNRDYAPDMVFGYNFEPKEGLCRNPNMLGISIINTKLHSNARQDYIHKMAELVNAYLATSEDKSVRLFGFDGGRENDEEVIDEVLQYVNAKGRVRKIIYNEKILIMPYLDLFWECSFVLASRFHSMILAARFGIPFFSIIYSKKMSNVLSDLGYFDNSVLYGRVHELDVPKLVGGMQNNLNSYSISPSVVSDSKKHFCGLDNEFN
jgi:colanic acid/amylovoran biosynthesis protein